MIAWSDASVSKRTASLNGVQDKGRGEQPEAFKRSKKR